MPTTPRLMAAALLLGSPAAHAASHTLALVGATVVDVSHHGNSAHDVADAVVLIRDGRVSAVGPRATLAIPAGAAVLDETGKFMIPGLIDGFCGMQSQAEANAQLYEGVTTIVASGDDRRGTLYLAADPSPHVYTIDSAGSTDDWSLLRGNPGWRDRLADGTSSHELSPGETLAQLDATARNGSRAIWIGHNITAANAALIVHRARQLHLATYGEFVATPYRKGIEAGVGSLLHMSRLELGLAPESLMAGATADPEGAGGDAAYEAADGVDPTNPAVAAYGDLLVASHVAVMPTFSLYYLLLPDHRNLWKEPASAMLDAKTMGRPSDPATGELSFSSTEKKAHSIALAAQLWALDQAIIARHPVVLAASGATWQGTMPGISLHTELELLVRAGLTPRQALAAATSNYAEQFGWTELGAVTPGRRADLVLLDADPTRDIVNADRIADVFVSGVKVDRTELLKAKPGGS